MEVEKLSEGVKRCLYTNFICNDNPMNHPPGMSMCPTCGPIKKANRSVNHSRGGPVRINHDWRKKQNEIERAREEKVFNLMSKKNQLKFLDIKNTADLRRWCPDD